MRPVLPVLAAVVALALAGCSAFRAPRCPEGEVRQAFTATDQPVVDAALMHVSGRPTPPAHGPLDAWQVTGVRVPPGNARAIVHIETYDTGDANGWTCFDVLLVKRGCDWVVTSVRRGLGKA